MTPTPSYPKAEWLDRHGHPIRFNGGLDRSVFYDFAAVPTVGDLFSGYAKLPDGLVAEIDRYGAITRANLRLMSLLDLPDLRALSANFFDLTHPEDAPIEQAALSRLVGTANQAASPNELFGAYEKRIVLPRAESAHYGSVFHVSCLIVQCATPQSEAFLVVMQEAKIFRHFKRSRGAR